MGRRSPESGKPGYETQEQCLGKLRPLLALVVQAALPQARVRRRCTDRRRRVGRAKLSGVGAFGCPRPARGPSRSYAPRERRRARA